MSESSTPALKKMDLSVNNSVGRVEPRFVAMAVTELTAEQVTAIIDNISDSCTLTLKKLNLTYPSIKDYPGGALLHLVL